MARKVNPVFPGREKAAQRAVEASWAAVGIDTSMTACSAVAMGFDAKTKKMVGPTYAEIRWTPDDDYFKRLGQAAKGHELVLDVLRPLWVIDPEKTFIAIEEPFPLGMIGRAVAGKGTWQGSFIKQQSEVSGAFKGSLVRYGYLNIYEINNAQWHATIRKDGIEFEVIRRAWTKQEKDAAKYRNKFLIKTWAVKAFGLPELPDLVASKSGAKVPRPAEGYGAKAKAVQPNDIYDAAACCAWMQDEIENGRVLGFELQSSQG